MDFNNGGNDKAIYYGLIAVFVLSFLITVTILIFSYRSSIKGSFIFYFITNLLIASSVHSFSYVLNFVDDNTNKSDFLCSLQSVILIMACQSQEIIVVIITFICFQAIINQKVYNFNDNLLFFIVCFIIGNVLIPGGLVLIFGFYDALGPYKIYCWIQYDRGVSISPFSLTIFIIKMIAISINITLSVIMLVIVCRKNNHIENNKESFNLCIKTIIFPLIQMGFIISWFILSRLGKNEIACFLSSSTGVIYPLYIGWYSGIVGSKHREEEPSKSISEMAIDKNSIRNSLMRESKMINEQHKIDSSIDYYE